MLLSVDFGTATITTVGYQLLTAAGVAVGGRVTTGITNLSNGQYCASPTLGGTEALVKWDTGGGSPVYALEDLVTDAAVQALPSAATIATQVLTSAQSTPIHANAKQMNDVAIIGTGVTSDLWRG